MIDGMATLIVRRLDQSLKAQLKMRDAQHGRSMEEEARLAELNSLYRPVRQRVIVPPLHSGYLDMNVFSEARPMLQNFKLAGSTRAAE